ncbi:N-acetyltransferase family protein [Fontivita pretiosa]|uniref:GNAT family N-acetyltransferase n=1 Tax=Fontivita pretiosa TaxID=2989684 RepID=UPI003D181055
MPDRLTITPATVSDVATILSFIRALAEYERLSHQCIATEQALRQTLFGPRRYAEVLIARLDDLPVGYALFFHSYSTFLARPGIYLEDLFVLPEHRGRGVGKALLGEVARIARQRDCGRLEWAVLDWNRPAIEFYRRLGATILPDWRICRLDEDRIADLAGKGP